MPTIKSETDVVRDLIDNSSGDPYLNTLANTIHTNAKNKGFYDKPKCNAALLMLVVSELGEALEADRRNHHTNIEEYKHLVSEKSTKKYKKIIFNAEVKDTFEDEIADSIIRLLDLSAYLKIDIDFHIKEKMEYNKSRSRLHGKNY